MASNLIAMASNRLWLFLCLDVQKKVTWSFHRLKPGFWFKSGPLVQKGPTELGCFLRVENGSALIPNHVESSRVLVHMILQACVLAGSHG